MVRLGMVGTIARGLVFCVVGVLVVDAAVTYDPKKSTGLDGALRTLAAQSYGPGAARRAGGGAHRLRHLRFRRGPLGQGLTGFRKRCR